MGKKNRMCVGKFLTDRYGRFMNVQINLKNWVLIHDETIVF